MSFRGGGEREPPRPLTPPQMRCYRRPGLARGLVIGCGILEEAPPVDAWGIAERRVRPPASITPASRRKNLVTVQSSCCDLGTAIVPSFIRPSLDHSLWTFVFSVPHETRFCLSLVVLCCPGVEV